MSPFVSTCIIVVQVLKGADTCNLDWVSQKMSVRKSLFWQLVVIVVVFPPVLPAHRIDSLGALKGFWFSESLLPRFQVLGPQRHSEHVHLETLVTEYRRCQNKLSEHGNIIPVLRLKVGMCTRIALATRLVTQVRRIRLEFQGLKCQIPIPILDTCIFGGRPVKKYFWGRFTKK